MTSRVRRRLEVTAVGAVAVVGASLLGACSAVLGIGDWADLTDGGSVDSAGIDGGKTPDSSTRDAKSKADAGRDASSTDTGAHPGDGAADVASDHQSGTDAQTDGGADARSPDGSATDATGEHDSASDAQDADAKEAGPDATDGLNAIITVMTTSLDFNSGADSNGGVGISCGQTGPTLDVVVMNTGTGDGSITALTLGLGMSSPYTVPAVPITIAAGATVNIPITPKMVLTGSLPAADLNDTLTVTTDVKGDASTPPATVALQETSAGAVLSLATTMIAFGSTPDGEKSTYQLALTNSGNVSAPITLSSGGNPVFTIDTSVVAAAGSNAFPNAYFMPVNPQTYNSTGSVVVAAGTPFCSSFSGSISLSLSGTGTTGNTYEAAPSSLAFGNNTCGATPPSPKTVTLTNSATATTTWTATLTGSGASLFQLSASSGMVNGSGATSSFTVKPIALSSTSGLTANEVQLGASATLTVVVGTGGSAETFTIPVAETPIGAFPSWSATQISVTGTGTFELENAATSATSFTLTSSSTSFPVSPTSGNSSNSAPLVGTVTYNSLVNSAATITASLTTPSDPLCGPIPAPLSVKGVGTL